MNPQLELSDLVCSSEDQTEIRRVRRIPLMQKSCAEVLSQQQEAEIGYSTAVALSDCSGSVICWDSGGCSERFGR